MRDLRNIIKRLLWENGSPSLTRVLAVWLVLFWCALTAWLAVNRIDWGGYAIATTTGLGGVAAQVINKFINGKYNSPAGSPGPRGED